MEFTKDLWVYVETDKEGAAKNAGLELLNPGRMLADKQGGKLVAVVIGENVSEAVKAAGESGAEQTLVVEGPEYEAYSTDAYAAALCHLIEKYGPAAVIAGATLQGRDLTPRVAAHFETGVVSDCTALDLDESGNILCTRPAYSGSLFETVVCAERRPQLGTVRPGTFKKPEPVENKAEVVREEFHVAASDIRTKLLEVIQEAAGDIVDLEGADVVVSGGRGVGGQEGFAPLQALADVLGGVVGASRAAVDAGWISNSHQVGQTGKTVAPRLYIACGISGAIQHLAGMSGSDCIVAINKDADAPIFSVADYGIVGNLFEVLPLLTEEIRKLKA